MSLNLGAASPSPTRFVDVEGKDVSNTIFGELTTAERTDRINIQFQYNISNKDVKVTETGTGSVNHITNARAELSTGTGVGVARVQSIDSIRYVPGKELITHFTASFATPEVFTTQKVGVFDAENGFIIGYVGTSFGVFLRNNGTDTFVSAANFNRNDVAVDPTKYAIWRITYGWLGIAPATISVFAGVDLGWVPLHTFDYTGEDGPHIGNTVLPIRMEATRTQGTGADLKLHTSSWRGGMVGKAPAGTGADRAYQQLVRDKVISGGNVLRPVFSIRNKTTFQGLTNHIRARYGTVAISTDGTKDVIVTVYRNGTLTSASFVDYDADNSVCVNMI